MGNNFGDELAGRPLGALLIIAVIVAFMVGMLVYSRWGRRSRDRRIEK